MREAVIVAGARTAVGKAGKGSLRNYRPDEMAAAVVSDLMRRVPQVDPKEVEDVILGCAFPEGEQGMNLARIVALRAGLPTEVPGMTVNRFCSSGLQTIAIAAEKIMCGFADIMIAGGVESMSMVPMGGYKPAPNPYLMEHLPETYMSMGHTAEEVAKRYNVTREDQDRFALASHQKAAAAIKAGKFKDEIVPLTVKEHFFDENGKLQVKERVFDTDEGVRPDTNLEVLGKLRPVFHVNGTVTAGNSSQTSDGAAAVMIMSREKAEELGVKPLAIFRGFTLGGVDPDVMGIGPVAAVPKLLEKTGIRLEDIDLIELNEAFASQSVAVIRELGLDHEKVNVNGGAIALGHPLGCSGAKLTVSILGELERRNLRYGLVTMCIGGGMGAAGIVERVS
ncbi:MULTISPECIES: acetyl-CoA C-acyltransferase [Thermoactinomyces]|jgi:acetyl-CoA acyltransferase|uniref:acetyl-CoA C-acyltransferase n=1 Tax=Thermoactinomyces vulgaris TaxID=2026 RepID=A0ABS0QGF5_THEVU|nr:MULTISPECIES: acetyl-CoA C-acyltransferase [Thermoactinomyces]KFZ41549.1 acetyl-CoA acetyltransferase [Thermoactinomyces sp. Gus2-1]KYQ86378.1 acetyl-CoA acetyltransferase [Thermoactinomyces sp. AS95]MBA4551864.1 acetyl-CoA C-acyltransferase [Thermoactinomyces vulgaris]MBA4597195.1 acetyl-CoA C-acyltransferase [Thermoactinomyces vulgaris]MBH8583390.1 acetyl-CoA C-acyltransferase [Thermoactinomyces sp. CICC 10735]